MLDWDDLQFFLAVARHGTLSAAARTLAVTQPTVGRRIAAFEARLGAQLFVRASAGWTLSAVGRSVLAHAERMQEQALLAESVARGRDAGVSGAVVITASEWVIRSVLGPALGPLLSQHPKLSLDLVAEAKHLSLVKREADIALRPSRFSHQDVLARAVAVIEFGLYASDAYLARHGRPDFGGGAPGHRFIAMTAGAGNVVERDWLPPMAASGRVTVRSNGREPMATMAAAGIGIACLPRFLGAATPGLRSLATPTPAPRRQLWLGIHRAARATPRIRVTVDFLAHSFARTLGSLQPMAAETT
jgi:DNA-binding transcriptional LysR family regulator